MIKETITLNDVAAEAGVSSATVSRVLNKHPQINNATRSRVYDAIQRLGYNTRAIEKKVAARSVAEIRTLNIELLICPLPEQKNMLSLEYFGEIFGGIQSFFNQTGNINLTIATWEADEALYGRQNQAILKKTMQMDGVLVMGNPSDQLLAQMQESGLDPVLIANNRSKIVFNTVTADDITGGMEAARCLIRRGHRKIGFLAGPERISGWAGRLNGAMLETMLTLGADHFSFRRSESTENQDAAQTLRDWLDEGTCPEALIVPCGQYVLAVERVLLERNMSCPEHLSLVSFDSFGIGTFTIRPTRLDTFPRQIGIKAAQRLIQMLQYPHSEENPHKVVIPMELVEGTSVKDLSR